MSFWVFLALFLPIIVSGLSVFLFKTSEKTLKLILAFGGAFLLSLVFIEIIPEVFESESEIIGIFVLLGFFIQLLLDFITKGVEHGHHSHHNELDKPCSNKHQSGGFLGVMIGICIHAFLEGMPLSSNFTDKELQGTLLSGIIIHNIPISIVLVSLIMHTGWSKKTAIIMLLIFALSSPLGTLVSYYFGTSFINDVSHFFNIILAIVVGIFLHISTTILFESDEHHKFNLKKFIVILLGFTATIILTTFLHHHH